MPIFQIQHRYDTTANWEGCNPVLLAGEMGCELKPDGTTAFKIGDGYRDASGNIVGTAWNSLPYASGPKGDTGDDGVPPEHEWNGTTLRFKNPDGSWGQAIDLKGPKGDTEIADLPVATSTTLGGIIVSKGLKVERDGSTSVDSAAMPTDNSTKIATTNWTRQAFPDWLSNNPSTSINADDQAAIHNGIYRGKNLTDVYTLDQLSAKLRAGDFTDLYIGDYITKPFIYNGMTTDVNWRFGHFNYWKYMGNNNLAVNHILMVPDTPLFNSKMQDTNTTEGGILATIVWQALQNAAYAAVNASNCMSGHVCQHRDLIPSTVDTESPSACGHAYNGTSINTGSAWVDIKLGMLKEPMVYGVDIFSSSGRDAGCGKSQIALFRLDPTWINGRSNRYNWWIGAVTSSSFFAVSNGNGSANCGGASTSTYGVRPYFLFS